MTNDAVMNNKRFSYFIILTFIAGALLLIAVQVNSAKNTKALINNNNTLLNELRSSNHLREIDRDILGVESRIRASIATNDTTHLEGIDNKIYQIEHFLDSLSRDNSDAEEEKLIHRLRMLAMDKKIVRDGLLERYHARGNMNDQTSIANPRARMTSNEITGITAKIYESRAQLMVELSRRSEEMGEKARLYDIALLLLLILSGAVVGFHILRQFKRQRGLIEELDAAEKKASIAAQTKENFLANMSHEIRTPLSGILGFTNLLQKRTLDPAATEFVASIQRSGEHLMTIINDILDLSKIEAGMMRITSGIFSINGLLHSVETLFLERAKEKGLSISCKIDPSIPDTLVGDATRLTQILVNLIGNAIKFTKEGSIHIEVFNKGRTENGVMVGFSIEDTGIGIEKRKLHEVFERFNQGEDAITRNYGGTGLGLSIVKNLVVLQHGDIEVSSELGKGTTFRFYIPYDIAQEQLPLSPVIDTGYFKDKANAPLRVLVVDDNSMNQSLMKHMLLQWNIAFDIVANGLEAVALLERKQFDLVLMDLQMPQMDGYAATRQIREGLQLDIPIIAMTAHALAGERERCLSRGMNEYISKPIVEAELFKLITHFGLGFAQQHQADVKGHKGIYNYIELSYMQEISRGDREFEQKVTRQFIDKTPLQARELKLAYETNDFVTFKLRAHDFKTSVAIMGLLPILEAPLNLLEHTTHQSATAEKALNEAIQLLAVAVQEAETLLASLNE